MLYEVITSIRCSTKVFTSRTLAIANEINRFCSSLVSEGRILSGLISLYEPIKFTIEVSVSLVIRFREICSLNTVWPPATSFLNESIARFSSVTFFVSRITSYNVCYTKLLRFDKELKRLKTLDFSLSIDRSILDVQCSKKLTGADTVIYKNPCLYVIFLISCYYKILTTYCT